MGFIVPEHLIRRAAARWPHVLRLTGRLIATRHDWTFDGYWPCATHKNHFYLVSAMGWPTRCFRVAANEHTLSSPVRTAFIDGFCTQQLVKLWCAQAARKAAAEKRQLADEFLKS